MFWRGFIFALVVAAAAAETFELSETQKDQAKTALRTFCKKSNAEDKVDDVIQSVHTFIECIKGLVNPEELTKEIEDAKPKGALDEVFKKYCAKSPQIKTCIHNVLQGFSPCLANDQVDLTTSAMNGTDQLIDFVCYKDGDRIALFISEKGPECFQEKSNDIRECATAIQASVDPTDASKPLTMAERCSKFDTLSQCIVTKLEGCNTPTPANMAESLFKFVRKSSPCNEALPLKN